MVISDRITSTLKGIWLVAGISAVVLPVILPSSQFAGVTGSPINVAAASMFLLSFPSSLLGVPLASFINFVFGTDSWSIGGRYLIVVVLSLLGAVQWFWIVPNIFGSRPLLQLLELSAPASQTVLATADIAAAGQFVVDGSTPLERVLRSDD